MPTLTFDSTDLGETEEFLSKAYTKMSIGGRPERTGAHITRESMGSVSLDELSFDYYMSHDAHVPIGKVCLCSVRDGGIVRRYRPDGTEGRFGPGDMFRYAPHDRTYTGVVEAARYSVIMFDPGLLSEVAATERGPASEPVQLVGDRAVSPAAARQLRATITHLRAHVLPDPTLRGAPLIVSTASQLLAASVLHAFPNNAQVLPTAADNHDAHPAALRRAVAYIDSHAAEPITLADIAEAARTTGRAVQLAFRRHYGLTPMAYLRRVRLEAAHLDLRAADPTTGDTVAAVAARWGFSHDVNFARFYREQFGELPSHTLRA